MGLFWGAQDLPLVPKDLIFARPFLAWLECGLVEGHFTIHLPVPARWSLDIAAMRGRSNLPVLASRRSWGGLYLAFHPIITIYIIHNIGNLSRIWQKLLCYVAQNKLEYYNKL